MRCDSNTTCFNTTCVEPAAFHTRRTSDDNPSSAAFDFSAASVAVNFDPTNQTQRI
ncbi:hypothetical protein CORC01_10007 [Colletotrichum orchidophilum]|uniref:Uncharacterized protein n=1 Tax=Colletotrichum orchidophilum TaxID=1209926 RepID=A0A1G4AZV3_9PEZI|nr:uncharacterized protein CORC01_10007 [Colletotrichum orchidophilum]OHE94698.1 hypothetical protein CORC01_10007 [Colletotrichum orchidophilum]